MSHSTQKSAFSLSLAIAAICLLSPLANAGQGPGAGANEACASVDTTVTPSAAETQSLGFMHEEEKLARDVYQTLYAQWQQPVFSNIARSEQVHMDRVRCFLDSYGLPVVASDTPNQFNTPELQTLYDTLTARGAESLSEALRVGALIEEVDMVDLQDAIDASDIAEVKNMYGNLMSGSENHLRAFVSNLERLGETYAAQTMEADAVNEILGGYPEVEANGVNLDDGAAVASETRFQPRMTGPSGRLGKGARVNQTETVSLDMEILPDSAHVGKPARLVSVALREVDGGNVAFVRHGQGNWQRWNGEFAALRDEANAPVTLAERQETRIFEGNFDRAPGRYRIFHGYAPTDSEALLFTSQPVEFEVAE